MRRDFKRYGEHLVFERWRTSTLSRMILALVHTSMSEKDWGKIQNLAPGAKVKVASPAKKYVTPLAMQLLLHMKKIDKERSGWAESCGRPDHLRPDALSTAWALRGLHAARLCGVSVKKGMWEKAARFLLESQESKGPAVELLGPDGKKTGKKTGKKIPARGFGHLKGDPADPDTTLDVLCSLHLCLLNSKPSAEFKGKIQNAIDLGLAWLQAHFPAPYRFQHLVSLKRLGALSGRKFIGKMDWHKEGLRFLTYQVKHRGFHPWTAGLKLGCALYFVGRSGL